MGFHEKLTAVKAERKKTRRVNGNYEPNFTFRLPLHLNDWVREAADKHDTNVTAIIVAALEEAKFNAMLEEALR